MDQTTIMIGFIILAAIGAAVAILRSGRQREAQGMSYDPKANSLDAIRQMSTPNAYQKMLSDIRSWGWTLVIFGIFHMIASGFLSLPHGILLIAVGALSFVAREASMYVLYAVTLAWAAIGNLTLGTAPGWALFGGFQVLLSVQVFRRFLLFKKVQKDYKESLATDQPEPVSPQPTRTDQIFPLASLVAGCGGLIGVLFGWGMILVTSATAQASLLNVSGLATDVSMIIGVLGFSLGLAALLSDAPRRALSIIGTVAGAVAMLTAVSLVMLARIAG